MASEKQLAVLLFTDIVGSVALQSKLGTEAYTRYIRRHDSIFKHCLSYIENSSILNETGDGFLVKFTSASDAVETALRLQCLMRREICEGEPMVLRIGLHMGEVSEMEEQITGDTRAVGMAINLCARIMDLAADGQILLTRGVFDEARQYTREHPPLEDQDSESLPPLQWPAHGRYIFKGTDEPMEIYEVGALALAPLTPPEDSAKAKRAVSAEEEATLGWRPGAGLPIPRHEKWIIAEKLGQGGFGEVWLATNDDTKERRVFKFCFDPEKLRSFKRELTLFRLLRDALGKRDDIASLYDVSVESPPFYLESEYVPSGNLALWAESKGGIRKIPLHVRIDLLAQIARALAAAHSVGVIHKDIKPSNILIHEAHGKPSPRIADFGIGTLSDSASLIDHNITGMGFTESIIIESDSGLSGGTQLYMAPEYLIGAPSSVRGDVFSLGVMLYQLAAGDLNKPMGSGWQRDIEDLLLREDILKCVDVDPERRFENANQLAEQLETLEERHKAQRREQEEAAYQQKLKSQAEKRRRLLLLGAVAMLGLLGVVASLYRGLQNQRKAMTEQMRLKDEAKIMASQADYALANEHLKQGHANMAVAHLARSLRSDPHNVAASHRLISTLTYHNFPRRLYPPLSLGDLRLEERALAVDVTSNGRLVAGRTANGGFEIFEAATGKSQFGVLLERPDDSIIELRFNEVSDRLYVKREKSYQLISAMDASIIADVDLRKERYGYNHDLSMDGRYWIGEHFTEPRIHIHELYGTKRWLIDDPKVATGNVAHYHASADGRLLAALWETESMGYLSVCDLHAETPAWKTIHEGLRWTRLAPAAVSTIDHTGRRIAFGDASGEIHVLDLLTGESLHTFRSPRDFIMALRFSPGDDYLAVGYFSQVARVWTLRTGELTSSPMAHQGAVVDLDFSDDGNRLLTASLDGQVRLWDPSKGLQLSQPMQHASQALRARFDDSEKRAITLTLAGQASIWDLTNTPAYDAPLLYDGTVLAMSADHQRLVILPPSQGMRLIKADGSLDVHQPTHGQGTARFRGFRGDSFVVGWLGYPGGNLISRLAPNGTNEAKSLPNAFPYMVTDYHAGSQRFLGGVANRITGQLADTTLELRRFAEADAPEPLLKLEHSSLVTAGALAPGGRYAVTTVRDQAYAWDLEETPPLPKKLGMSMIPTSIAIAENVPKVLIGTITGVAQLWDIDSLTSLSDTLRHEGPISLVDLNADATIAVTVSFPAAQGLVTAEFRAWNLTDSTPITPPIPVTTPPGLQFNARPDFSQGFLSLSQDETYAIVCIGPDITRIDLQPSSNVAPLELPDLAEGISGFRVDENTGRPLPLSQKDRAAKLASSIPADPAWKRWAGWITQNAAHRTIAPHSDLGEDAYLKHLLGRHDAPSFRRALAISANHPAALAGLGKAVMAGKSGAEEQALATFYVRSALTQIEEQGIVRQKGLETAYSDIVEVSLKLGDIAKNTDDHDAARHHISMALRAAIDACETNPERSEGQMGLSLAYLYQSHLVEGALRDAYLDAAILTLALLKAEGSSVDARLDEAVRQRWTDFSEGIPIIAPGNHWRYSAERPGDDTWKMVGYDDSSWNEGGGPLGYGDDFAKTVVPGNPLSLYLRHTFTLSQLLAERVWRLHILYDDGAAIYLDGELIHEENFRQGKVLRVLPSEAEGKYVDREIAMPALTVGPHTIAIEVHQEKPTSTDLMIDLAAFIDGVHLASKLRLIDRSTIDRIVDRLGDQVPPSWAERWRFYHADIADAASPLALSPSAFYRRALVQESRHRFKDAIASAQTVLRLSQADPDNAWRPQAQAILDRLR